MEADAAIGPPEGMAEKADELTPMLSQYFELCTAYEDSLVLFQVGDFYETFCEAAEVVSRELEITLTKREDSTGTYPMAGIPVDSAASYIEGLLDAGFRVAVADQVQDPSEASGPVDRAVTRVVTPGTVIDDDLLEAGTSNYVACLAAESETEFDAAFDGPEGSSDEAPADGATLDDRHAGRDGDAGDRIPPDTPAHENRTYAVAFADVSTGEFLLTSASRDLVADELERFDPSEIVLAPEVDTATFAFEGMVTPPREGTFDPDTARERVEAYGHDPDTFERLAEIRACGALLAYVEYTQGDVTSDGTDGAGPGSEGKSDPESGANGEGDGSPDARIEADGPSEAERGRFGDLVRYDPRQHLRLDATALRSLEVFENRSGGDDRTLVSVLDETSCALGRRRLTGWLRRPLLDPERIEARLDAVEELAEASLVREELRDLLRDVYDVERLITRVSRGRANARDLRSLKDTLDVVPRLREALAAPDSRTLVGLRDELDELGDVRGLIGRAIRPEPPIEVTEGGVIRPEFDETLADLRGTEREGREWITDLEAHERERTGIDSLSVGFNQVHGYYIEVTKANLERVPEEYTRRQTLKNAERFYTPELKQREDEILSAGERADGREYDLFREVRADVAAEADRVSRVADALADLDALATLAAVATDREYARPHVDADTLAIEAGRHPVVETVGEFVPNDARLDPGALAIVTGPNMSGKSTYMRQIALCVLLAQIGSFVPARSARLPIVDRIFTRIGASDDIAGGQSTFMREMTELTTILRDATADSLVLLDEVGRGTSTADGRAIARAAAEYVHDAIGARTLFATHYHELTDLADERERVRNLHFAVDGDPSPPSSGPGRSEPPTDVEVTFLHAVAEGASSSSYGIDVARLAGVPDPVVERSRELVADGDADEEPSGIEGESAGADSSEADSTDEGAPEKGVRSSGAVGTSSADEPTDPVGSGSDVDGAGGIDGSGSSGGFGDFGDAQRPRSNGRATNGRRRDRNANETRIGLRNETRDGDDGSTPNGEIERENGTGGGDGTVDLAVALSGIDLANTTPIEALNHLNRLKRRLDDRRDGPGNGRRGEPSDDR